MANIAKHFTVTKHLPDNFGSIEFSGIVYNCDADNYEIEDVRYHTACQGNKIVEEATQFFHMIRATSFPEFHHDDICELLTEFLRGGTYSLTDAVKKVQNDDFSGDNVFNAISAISQPFINHYRA